MLKGKCFNSHTVCYAHELNENKNFQLELKVLMNFPAIIKS